MMFSGRIELNEILHEQIYGSNTDPAYSDQFKRKTEQQRSGRRCIPGEVQRRVRSATQRVRHRQLELRN